MNFKSRVFFYLSNILFLECLIPLNKEEIYPNISVFSPKSSKIILNKISYWFFLIFLFSKWDVYNSMCAVFSDFFGVDFILSVFSFASLRIRCRVKSLMLRAKDWNASYINEGFGSAKDADISELFSERDLPSLSYYLGKKTTETKSAFEMVFCIIWQLAQQSS